MRKSVFKVINNISSIWGKFL